MQISMSPEGKINILEPRSQSGDRMTLSCLEDCVVAVSACSVEEAATNSKSCSSIGVEIFDLGE